ncbi:hypothetical protein QTS76_01870 [Micromonospora sp. b486]|nr:hypothetical protein [Micromonospora sp. b486]MDM4777995.1 hypothetical protein [Micromonospora sp. b486]
MATPQQPPIGVRLATDVEHRPGRDRPYRARVRWTDRTSNRRLSKSTTVATLEEAQAWLDGMASAAQGGVDPIAATKRLAKYGESVMTLALRGLERKTLDPYLAGGASGWCRRSAHSRSDDHQRAEDAGSKSPAE